MSAREPSPPHRGTPVEANPSRRTMSWPAPRRISSPSAPSPCAAMSGESGGDMRRSHKQAYVLCLSRSHTAKPCTIRLSKQSARQGSTHARERPAQPRAATRSPTHVTGSSSCRNRFTTSSFGNSTAGDSGLDPVASRLGVGVAAGLAAWPAPAPAPDAASSSRRRRLRLGVALEPPTSAIWPLSSMAPATLCFRSTSFSSSFRWVARNSALRARSRSRRRTNFLRPFDAAATPAICLRRSVSARRLAISSLRASMAPNSDDAKLAPVCTTHVVGSSAVVLHNRTDVSKYQSLLSEAEVTK